MRCEAEGRETSGATTGLVLCYVREVAGDAAVEQVLARADVPYPREVLEDGSSWTSYDARIRLFEAATAVLGDEDAAYRIGATAMERGLNPSLVLLLRALGSPAQVFRQLPRSVPKFSTTSTMTILEHGPTHATLRYALHDGYRHSRLDCRYAQGLFAAVPTIFGLPPARVLHEECESDGAPACVYLVTWDRRLRGPRRRRARAQEQHQELMALRGQLEALQSAATDLVSSDDLGQVLTRITERAAAAVLAQGYLLAVRVPEVDEPLVRSAGLDAERAERTARTLLDGGDLGPSAVVVDVRSSRGRYGRLAALYSEGQSGMADERRLLTAYAGQAAAALDLLCALEASRRGESRATALLMLTRELSAAVDTDSVARVVARALPRIVGCKRGAVLLWDADEGHLRPSATSGLPPETAAAFLEMRLRPEDSPELVDMLTRREPLVLEAAEVSPPVGRVFEAVGLSSVVVVPLVAGDELLGVATASWGEEGVPAAQLSEVLTRVRGVADHAQHALLNAMLLDAVWHQSQHDALTGLANRSTLTSELERAVRQCATADRSTSVLFCDLDRFKAVNDAYGHAAGDELLRQVAGRLRAAVREGDVVARLSGDEFAVVLPDVAGPADAEEVARRLAACFAEPFRIEGHELRVTGSVGAAVQTGPGGRGERLLRAADRAMYDAKRGGRNQVVLAVTGGAQASSSASFESELATAVESGELRLLFQPITDVAGSVVGAEALVRWAHPRLGLLTPSVFLPMAQETGLMVGIDRWVLEAACAAAAQWGPGPDGGPLKVAVNVAVATLASPTLESDVRSALARHGLAADRLCLELVESRSLLDVPSLVDRLAALRRLGVDVALDDFGTGYSTLAWLRELPVNALKIDRSFTAALPDPAAHALVRGLVAIAGELGMRVVVEGVETEEQLAVLRGLGASLVQGFLVGRPAEGPPRSLHGLVAGVG